MMKLQDILSVYFVDCNVEVISAYADKFKTVGDCRFVIGNILSQDRGCLVSPANSYGNMSGGIDRQYRDYFGPELEQRLRVYIDNLHGRKLKIGNAQIVPTNDDKFPYIIFCPTVEKPSELTTGENVRKAAIAIFRQAVRYNFKVKEADKIDRLLIPGFGTDMAGLDPHISAKEMYLAYLEVDKEIQELTSE